MALFNGTIQEDSYTRYQHATQLSTYLLLQENYRLFNEGSNGAFILRGANLQGDFEESVEWKITSSLVRSRLPGDTSAIALVGQEQFLQTAVRFASGTPELAILPDQAAWINRDPEEAAAFFSQKLAQDMYYYQVNCAVASLIAAYLNVDDCVHDITSDTVSTVDVAPLIDTAQLFGDQSTSLRTWIMHSKPFTDFQKARAFNTDHLVTYGDVNVHVDTAGRAILVTDNPNLRTVQGGQTHYYTLGLRPGAVELRHGDDFLSNISSTNGQANIKKTFQAEWSDLVNIPGFTWVKTSGGVAPTPAALSSSSNWALVDSNIEAKATHCAILKSN